MTIDEASKRIAVSKDMIRHYEKLGLIIPRRRANGYREYTEDDLNTLVLIRMLSNSHIPLKDIRRSFREETVDSLLMDFEKELEHIQMKRRQLQIRETALKLELSRFQQYADNCEVQLCHYPDRWVLWKVLDVDMNFDSAFQLAAAQDAYFHYLACHEVDIREHKLNLKQYHQGVLLYDAQPGAELIQEQDCLRVILTHEPGRMLGMEDLMTYILDASEKYKLSESKVLSYQIFHHMGCEEKCVVCTEILLGEKQ